MKFGSILGALAPASPELDAITDVLRQVQGRVDNLCAVIKENGPAIATLVEAFHLIASTITSGIETISALDKLSFTSSLLLSGPVSELKDQTQLLSDSLLEMKPQIDAQGDTGIVGKQAAGAKEAAQSLIEVIVDKVSSKAQSRARQEAQGIVEILGHLEDSFSSDQLAAKLGDTGRGETAPE
ncbi:hypothetical protein E4U31_006943 [Claviceps sp. LM219 group G6]|nr:hypothetical protein E4U31_006943 [Claviceps sp. LM219 group G6]